LKAIADCLNITALDSLFQSACCPSYATEGYLSHPKGAALKAACASKEKGIPLGKCPLNPSSLPYKPPGEYISDAVCNRSDQRPLSTKYKDSVFDCKALPVCEVTCGGPDEVVVGAACKHCSCMIEWLINSSVFQFAMGVVVYLLMNISRVMLCRGFVMIFWRSLTREEFEVRTTCSRAGEMVAQPWESEEGGEAVGVEGGGREAGKIVKNREGDVELRESERVEGASGGGGERGGGACTSKGPVHDDECGTEEEGEEEEGVGSFERQRKKNEADINGSIERMLTRFVIKGWIYVILGVALNIGWLVALMQVHQNISYTPKKS
jgi:hypothetical protein